MGINGEIGLPPCLSFPSQVTVAVGGLPDGACPLPAARGARFDRWLDRLVDAAVIIALLVGGIALVLTLLR